jgi:hypothetical protein
MNRRLIIVESLVVLLAWHVAAAVAAQPGILKPFADDGIPLDVGRPTGPVSTMLAVGIQAGADHIITDQCLNGGFGWWPHGDCTATYNNITGPICLGLLSAYTDTGDVDHLNAALAGGGYDLTSVYGNMEFRFGAFAPYFLWQLSLASGNPAYSTHAATYFFGELNAGTYGPGNLNTAGWIAAVQAGRTGAWVNLRPWEFHNLIPAATAIGVAGQDALFLQGVLDGLNTLDNTAPATVYSDLIGLAGGVRGLALNGTTSFTAISSPNHAGISGISTLQGLADMLASYQNPDGSWYWHSNLVGPTASDEDTQTTAYAVLALVAADPLVASDYSAAVQNARFWLFSMQLASGGFLSYPGGDQNTEVEGEALSAVSASGGVAVPTVSEWGLIALTMIGVAAGALLFWRKRSSLQS